MWTRRLLRRPRFCTRTPSFSSTKPGSGGIGTWWSEPTTAWSVTTAWRWARPQGLIIRSQNSVSQPLFFFCCLVRLLLKEFLHARSCCLQGAPFWPPRRSTCPWWTSVSPTTPVSERLNKCYRLSRRRELMEPFSDFMYVFLFWRYQIKNVI